MLSISIWSRDLKQQERGERREERGERREERGERRSLQKRDDKRR
jgi:hypothetical protein